MAQCLRFIVLTSLLVSTPGRSQPEAVPVLTLVEDGASRYTIVRSSSASSSQIYAAEELQRFVQQMTGATLPIQTDEAPLPSHAILLGLTRHTASIVAEAPDLKQLGDDGFRLLVRAPHLAIVGSAVRGTLYGVYELLEKFGGCRWYASYFSVIPQRKTWTLPALAETQTPAFAMREPFWWDMFVGDFAARCKANGNRMDLREKHGGKVRFGGGLFVHTFYRLMPPDEFFVEHPEYYSELAGKRVADHAQLCLTNPDVLRIMTERVLKSIRQDPDAKLFSVSQNDWRNYCTCEKCRAIDEREGSPSGTMIHFVNQVAEAVEREFPNAWIETLAYQYTRHPPRTLRPRSNVVPRLCSIECDFSVPLNLSTYQQNRTFVDDIVGWAAITDKLYVWDYTTNFGHYVGCHPNFPCLQGNAKFFRDNSVVGLFEQGAYQSRHAEFAELRAWVLAKLLWNPDQNIETLYEDFFQGFYGPAAPLVRQYFDELQALAQPEEHVLRIWAPMTSKWYSDEFFAHATDLWQQAEQAVAGQPRFLYNVRMSGIPVLYAKLQRWPTLPKRFVWKAGRMRAEAIPEEYAALAREFLARLEEGNITRVAENVDRHQAFVALLKSRTKGLDSVTVEGAAYHATVVPEMGARVVTLAKPGQPNILKPGAGGLGFTVSDKMVSPLDTSPFSIAQAPARQGTFTKTLRRKYQISRNVAPDQTGLTLSDTYTSLRTEGQTIRPVCQAAFHLGPGDSIVIRIAEQAWRLLTIPEDQTRMPVTVAAGAAVRELTLASPATARGVKLILPGSEIDRIWLVADAEKNTVQVFVAHHAFELGGKEKITFATRLEPLDSVPGLPTAPSPVQQHTRRRVAVEECMIGVGRPGTWGDIVPDQLADDGFAAKLYNTHYEWCMQWRIDPSLFEPGTPYRVRVRARVEKGDHEGEAFWAGVYDYTRKKSNGQIAPRTNEVKDGYQWYEMTTWTPEEGQCVWIGPGRFDKTTGEKSAIRALYIDRLELVRTTE